MEAAVEAFAPTPRSVRASAWSVIASLPRIPFLIVAVALLTAASADLLTTTVLRDPGTIDLPAKYAPPWPLEGSTTDHLLGADRLGRDVLSRLIAGARLSLSVALVVIAIGASVGTAVGVIAGYVGGLLETIVMRVVDVMLSFPAILVALVLVVTIGASFWMVVIVLSLHLWPQFARVVRAEVLVWKERGFVVLARATGSSTLSILWSHILPNVLNSIVVMATLQVGWIIVAEAGLSFLGAGVPPPTPTWGNMLAEGRDAMATAWWLTVFPGLSITMVVLSFNLLGDWLRDTIDPRLRQLAP